MYNLGKYGMFSEEKIKKILYQAFREMEEVRDKCRETLKQEHPDRVITNEEIDQFIANKLVPKSMKSGTADAIIMNFLEMEQSHKTSSEASTFSS